MDKVQSFTYIHAVHNTNFNKMKQSKIFIWSLLFFAGLLTITGCQQDDLLSPNLTRDQVAVEEKNYPAVERLVLDRYFRVKTEGLSDEAVTAKYKEILSLMPEHAQINLNKAVNKAGTRQSLIPSSQPQLRRSRTKSQTEAVINAPVPAERFAASIALAGNRIYAGSSEVQEVYEYQNSLKGKRTPSLISTITPSVPAEDFGEVVSVSGQWMAVAATGAFGSPGQVFMFKRIGGNWVEQTILTGPATSQGFGLDLVLKGNTLAVVSLDFATFEGTISVFNLSGNQWMLVDELTRPGNFWLGVDLDVIGKRSIAPGVVNLDPTIARASIFSLRSSNWTFEQELIITDTAASFAGDAVISLGRVIITTFEPGDRQYLFTLNGGTWSFAQELVHPLGSFGNNRTADIQANRIVIGAAAVNGLSESIYVFDKQGSTFNLTKTLTPADDGVDVLLDEVIIRGNNIAAGCRGDFTTPGSSGRIYIFKM